MDLCFLVPGVPADGDAAAQYARLLAARHAVTLALCDERPPGVGAARDGEPRVLAVEAALADRYDVAVAFHWSTTAHLFSVDAQRHASYVEALAHEQMAAGDARRIAAQLSYDLPVDFLAGAPWVARALADARPDARVLAATRGVARGDAAGDAVVVLAGDALADVLAGRVVVASSALPGIDDVIVHGENGYLVEPDDDRAAARFVELLEGDDALRARMSAAARATPWPDPEQAAAAFEAGLGELLAVAPPDAARWPVRLMADAMAGVAVFGTEHAALASRVAAVQADPGYRALARLRGWLRRVVPAPLRAALAPLRAAARRG